MRTFICIAFAALAADPAFAQDPAAVPEPSNIAIFGLGLLGLIVGRHFAKNRKNHDD
ncbi:PEP-CTERM sorting domain-containing protein [Parerythrobacter lacustris]|uniref:PEP-CTERM sorting domain-containing protein n=1 Tax=Parerythrobacter lacustris TaxID=2969984 RepID=A0ABT1XP58_9SPHN|nr:PEP-CTERM sorting domain-containing protein [Parerythrobacter lacustris]MCR2833002.1 PEP-CTERM sorting domain-containing protein [Parerythrobacter lacustris]